jgi:phenylacetate-CoA ligase
MNRHAAAVYRAAPVWGQNLMLSAFSAMLQRERYGGRYAEYRDRFAASDRASRQQLEADQDAGLRRIVEHAYATVPFYRQRFDAAGVKPSDVRGRADLARLPLLTRDDVRAHFGELRSSGPEGRGMREGHTSGTTGTPLSVGYDHDAVWATYAIFDRHYRWAGCRFGKGGDRVAVARGNVIVPLEQKGPPFWRRNRVHNQLLLSSFHLSRANLPAYLEALRRFQPAVVDGYPSTLYVLARFLQSRGETLPVRAAITSSETLYDFQRQVIEERFACRIFDYYALAERVIFSGECEAHEGRHIAMEYGVAEVVDDDGQPCRPGVEGRLVGTSLHNRAMPLIRYVTNDRTALMAAPCRCGRAHDRMADVTTKSEDMLTLPDGRLISPSVLTHPFKPLDSIEGSQIVQTAADRVLVRIVPGATYDDGLTAHLKSELQARLGPDVRIDIEKVERLEQAKSGKFKWVTSKVELGI